MGRKDTFRTLATNEILVPRKLSDNTTSYSWVLPPRAVAWPPRDRLATQCLLSSFLKCITTIAITGPLNLRVIRVLELYQRRTRSSLETDVPYFLFCFYKWVNNMTRCERTYRFVPPSGTWRMINSLVRVTLFRFSVFLM